MLFMNGASRRSKQGSRLFVISKCRCIVEEPPHEHPSNFTFTHAFSSPIQDDTLEFICSSFTGLKCNTLKASKVIGELKLTQHNIPYHFKYRKPDNSTGILPTYRVKLRNIVTICLLFYPFLSFIGACVPRLDLGENYDQCMVNKVEEWCTMLVPVPNNCVATFLAPLAQELFTFEKKRWKKNPQDHYHVLDLTRDATMSEVEAAYRRLAREFKGSVSPYDHFGGNVTEEHYWDPIAAKRYRVVDAYKDLSSHEDREFWDQPCEWLFNGAMCGRRTKDGGNKRFHIFF
jgi:hypothetical protein